MKNQFKQKLDSQNTVMLATVAQGLSNMEVAMDAMNDAYENTRDVAMVLCLQEEGGERGCDVEERVEIMIDAASQRRLRGTVQTLIGALKGEGRNLLTAEEYTTLIGALKGNAQAGPSDVEPNTLIGALKGNAQAGPQSRQALSAQTGTLYRLSPDDLAVDDPEAAQKLQDLIDSGVLITT